MAITLAGQGQRGFIVLGNHGTPDLVLHKPTEVLEITASGLTKEWLIDLAAWGLTPPSEIYSVARLPEWSTWMRTGDRGWWDGLLGQSAFLWYAAGRAESLNAAAEQMRRFRDEERGLKK
jgi:anthranilate phosphoribosyltransferase